MTSDEIVQIFDTMGVENYDGFNSHFNTISTNLHFLTMLILNKLPSDAKILCVGVGTGADIMDLAKINKKWRFTGIEPSASMLNGCKKKIEQEGLTDRCDFFQGYLSEFSSDQKYDAVLCFFVFHFIPKEERKKIYSDMHKHLKNGGQIVHAEISCDLESDNFPSLLNDWKSLHSYAGGTEEKLVNMEKVLKEQLSILSPKETEKLIQESEFKNPVPFFQSFIIRGWHAKKAN